jgi:tRNA(fMet)-specific endonuclease VapC
VPYLFDTDAISEIFRPRPLPAYLRWLAGIPRREQHTSAVVIGELFAGAFLAADPARHLRNIRDRLLPEITLVPFDLGAAEEYGRIRAALTAAGTPLPDADLQIAATAISNRMVLVTGNLKHHARIPGLQLSHVLADARAEAAKQAPSRRR